MPANRARRGVQSLYTFVKLKNDLLHRHDPNSRQNSTRGIAADYGITCGTVARILRGIEPKRADIRRQLGLPELAPAPVCPVHGVVHISRSCPKPDSFERNAQEYDRRKQDGSLPHRKNRFPPFRELARAMRERRDAERRP